MALLFFRFVLLDAFSITLKEFSRLHYCLIIKVLSSLSLRQLSYFIISNSLCQQLFYFHFTASRQLNYFIISIASCQHIFQNFLPTAAPPETYNGLNRFCFRHCFKRLCYPIRILRFWQVLFLFLSKYFFTFVFCCYYCHYML